MSSVDEIEVVGVWLVTGHATAVAHLFDDYLRTPHGAFLATRSYCGARRDPNLRVPADLAKARVCSRCTQIHEKRMRRAEEYAAAQQKYGVTP